MVRAADLDRRYVVPATGVPCRPWMRDIRVSHLARGPNRLALELSSMNIASATGICAADRSFMLLWSRFSHEYDLVCDRDIPRLVLAFARTRGQELIERGLRRSFANFLLTLCMRGGLIGREAMVLALDIVDSFQPGTLEMLENPRHQAVVGCDRVAFVAGGAGLVAARWSRAGGDDDDGDDDEEDLPA